MASSKRSRSKPQIIFLLVKPRTVMFSHTFFPARRLQLFVIALILILPAKSWADDQLLTHVKLGNMEVPILAETDDAYLVQVEKRFVRMKKAESGIGQKYEGCDLNAAQEYLLKDNDKALDIYEKCLEIHPKDALLYRAAGVLGILAEDYQKSEACFREAVALEPDNGIFIEQLADVMAINGKMEEARRHYGVALQKVKKRELKRLEDKIEKINGFGHDGVVKSYLLDYKGVRLEEAIISGLSYKDTLRDFGEGKSRRVYFESDAAEGRHAVIATNAVYNANDSLKRMNILIQEEQKAFDERKDAASERIKQLKKKLKKAGALEKENIQVELSAEEKKLMEETISYVGIDLFAKSRMINEIETEIKKAAEVIGKRDGYAIVSESTFAVTGISITNEVAETVNRNYSRSDEEIEKLIKDIRDNLQIRESLNPAEFLAGNLKGKAISSANKGGGGGANDKAEEKDQRKQDEDKVIESSKKSRFADHGFTLEIDKGFTSWKALGRKNIFYEDDGEILWFGQLSNWGKVKDAWARGKYSIEWIAPDGRTFLRETMSPTMTRFQDLIYSKLSLIQFKDIPKGEWHIKVWRKDDLIHEAKFEIN